MITYVLIFPFSLVLGLIFSIDDIKRYKVKNNLILLGFIWGIVVYITLFLTGYLAASIFKKILFNVLIAFIFAVIIWRLGFWAAGDAKIFSLFAFLLPVELNTSFQMFNYRFLISFLGNIFILIILYLFFDFSIRFIKDFIAFNVNFNENIQKLKFRFFSYWDKVYRKKIDLVIMLWGFFCMLILIRLIGDIFNRIFFSWQGKTIYYFFLFFIFRFFTRIIRKRKDCVLVATIELVFYVVYNYSSIGNIAIEQIKGFLSYSLSFIGLFFILNQIFNNYIEKKSTKKISIFDLKPGMVLTDKMKSVLKCNDIGTIYPDGLTRQQVQSIKDNVGLNKSGIEIEICRFIPVVPFIYLGYIITYLIKPVIIKLLVPH